MFIVFLCFVPHSQQITAQVNGYLSLVDFVVPVLLLTRGQTKANKSFTKGLVGSIDTPCDGVAEQLQPPTHMMTLLQKGCRAICWKEELSMESR